MFAGKKSAQIREILISESTWEEMTCLFAPSLAYPLGEAPAKLRCTSSADMVTVSNPTPYFITLTDLKIGGKVVKNQMISPFDKYQFSLPKGAKNSSVTYRTINDYGAETPQLNCKS
ncbi:periplasmic pilin chaperone [Escherichia coli]|nr:periplasmic pilin chaperone [Escherichia coli]SQN95140.1 periplasmic pilin chaperone [Escherichia coli]SQO00449.1 periplasmic pilin chaperone [Escherichia coli]